MSSMSFTMRQLLEAGVHFGHHTRRWNPAMRDYIYGVRNNTHILDLRQSVPLLHRALEAVREVTASGGRVLMVGTKRQAAEKVAETAQKTGQYYVNHRWLGGMLTNWKTISISIKRLKDLDVQLAGEIQGLTKKELLNLTRERDKLERALGGIREMGGLPDILFIIDTNKEQLAIQEANKLGIPIVAILDSNSDPAGVQFPVPGNDDAMRAISLYCDLVGSAVLTGLQAELVASGQDLGDADDIPVELGLEQEDVPSNVLEESAAKEEVPSEETASEAVSAEEVASEAVSAEETASEAVSAEETASDESASSKKADTDSKKQRVKRKPASKKKE